MESQGREELSDEEVFCTDILVALVGYVVCSDNDYRHILIYRGQGVGQLDGFLDNTLYFALLGWSASFIAGCN